MARILREGYKLFVGHQVHLHDGDLQQFAGNRHLSPLLDPIQGLLDAWANLVPKLLFPSSLFLLGGFVVPLLRRHRHTPPPSIR
ncbi:hypothetical protein D3C77_662930 [compost metagenome]